MNMRFKKIEEKIFTPDVSQKIPGVILNEK